MPLVTLTLFGTTEPKHSAMGQQTSDFSRYLAVFNHLSSKVKWDDTAKLQAFLSGLHN